MFIRRDKYIQRGLAVFLCVLVIIYILPYVWMVSISLKPDAELFTSQVFPENPSLVQYERLLIGFEAGDTVLEYEYPQYYVNSIFVTLSSLILVLTLDALAAFAFAKFDFRGRKPLFWLMMVKN